MEVILNKQQEEAKNKIVNWFNNINDENQYFVLGGYAGTGKTFLINYIINNILNIPKESVAFVAPTGKASCVLIQKGATNAGTIHRLIYNAVEVEKTSVVNGKEIKTKKTEFIKKTESLPYKLIVVDEASMISLDIFTDLLSYGIPLLCAGDPGQLPAVGRKTDILDKPDFTLTEIVRQESDNIIVKLATMVRHKEYIPYGNYGDVIVVDKNSLSEEQYLNLLLKADQVLCGLNKTRREINLTIKKAKGLDIDKLNLKEKIMCYVNNYEKYLDEDEKYNLTNGTIGYVTECEILDDTLKVGKLRLKPDFLSEESENYLYDTGIFKTGQFTYDMHQRVYEMSDGTYKLKKFLEKKKKDENSDDYRKRVMESVLAQRNAVDEEHLVQFDTAYCISVHKSQGSEWDKVVLIDESWSFNEPEKWLYTGITRAKKKLVIIR